MSVCNLCSLDSKDAGVWTCVKNVYLVRSDGKVRFSITLGGSKACPGCDILPGGYHHPGCKEEICPWHHKPLTKCKCDIAEHRNTIDQEVHW